MVWTKMTKRTSAWWAMRNSNHYTDPVQGCLTVNKAYGDILMDPIEMEERKKVRSAAWSRMWRAMCREKEVREGRWRRPSSRCFTCSHADEKTWKQLETREWSEGHPHKVEEGHRHDHHEGQ